MYRQNYGQAKIHTRTSNGLEKLKIEQHIIAEIVFDDGVKHP